MTIERVHSPRPERVRNVAGTIAAPARSKGNPSSDTAPQDRIVVSDQARQLATRVAGEQGTGLRLDFKKLRELAFAPTAPSAAPPDSEK